MSGLDKTTWSEFVAPLTPDLRPSADSRLLFKHCPLEAEDCRAKVLTRLCGSKTARTPTQTHSYLNSYHKHPVKVKSQQFFSRFGKKVTFFYFVCVFLRLEVQISNIWGDLPSCSRHHLSVCWMTDGPSSFDFILSAWICTFLVSSWSCRFSSSSGILSGDNSRLQLPVFTVSLTTHQCCWQILWKVWKCLHVSLIVWMNK